MEFHKTQGIVASNKHTYRVVCCGRQWGKTTLSAWEMLACAYAKKDRNIAYFATTFEQARDIAWRLLKDIAKPLISSVNETRLEIQIITQDGGISNIWLRGFENVDRARGQQFDLIVLDEVAKMRRFQYGWESVLEPTLGFRKGAALFISTPQGYDHFHSMWKRGQTQSRLWKSWQFTTYDNPFFPRERIEHAKGSSTQDWFNQEYLAQFVRFTGLIYKKFSMDHQHYFDHTYNQHGDYYFGLDFAVRGYTAALVGWMKSDGHIYIVDEYKENNLTAEENIDAIRTMLTKYADLGKYTGYADPSGFKKDQQTVIDKKPMMWSIADEYLEADLPIVKANNEVTAGINYVHQLFANNKIHIHPRCTKLIEELLQYQWKDQPETQTDIQSVPEKPRKIHDHLVDALRYMLYSKPSAPDEDKKKRKTIFPAQFKLKIEEPKKEDDNITPVDIPSIYS